MVFDSSAPPGALPKAVCDPPGWGHCGVPPWGGRALRDQGMAGGQSQRGAPGRVPRPPAQPGGPCARPGSPRRRQPSTSRARGAAGPRAQLLKWTPNLPKASERHQHARTLGFVSQPQLRSSGKARARPVRRRRRG